MITSGSIDPPANRVPPWPKVGEEVKQHFARIPKMQQVVTPDQDMLFEDLDGDVSSDSGLESIL